MKNNDQNLRSKTLIDLLGTKDNSTKLKICGYNIRKTFYSIKSTMKVNDVKLGNMVKIL